MIEIIPMILPEQIQEAVQRMAEEIIRDFADEPVILLGVLNGGAMLMADLSRKLGVNVAIDFVRLSSYGDGTESSGTIRMISPPHLDFAGKSVIIVEDIVDSGQTIGYLGDFLYDNGALSVHVCAMLDKPARRVVERVSVNYCGFTIEDKYVVGYGLDYAQKYRNLPFIAEVKFDPSDGSPPPPSPTP